MEIKDIEKTLTELACSRAQEECGIYREQLLSLFQRANNHGAIEFKAYQSAIIADESKEVNIRVARLYMDSGRIRNLFLEGVVGCYYKTRKAYHYDKLKKELLTRAGLLS